MIQTLATYCNRHSLQGVFNTSGAILRVLLATAWLQNGRLLARSSTMVLSQGKTTLFSIALFAVVCWVGGMIMMGIEYAGLNGNRPVTEAMNLTQRLQNFMTTNLSIEMNISSVDALLREVEENLKRGASSSRSSWKTDVSINTYRKWVYFIIMTMTTVGYGDVLPETVGGKIFAIFFSFIGIPVCTYMVATVGSFLCMQFALLKYRVRKNLLKQQVEMKVSIYCVIQCTTITLLFVVMAGVIIATAEGLGYFDGIYFSFITFTTIGYGDFTLRSFMQSKWYAEILGCFGAMGLILMAMTFNTISKLAELKEEGLAHDSNEKRVAPQENIKKFTTTV